MVHCIVDCNKCCINDKDTRNVMSKQALKTTGYGLFYGILYQNIACIL